MSTISPVQAEIEKIRQQGEQDRAWITAELEELRGSDEPAPPASFPWAIALASALVGAGVVTLVWAIA